MSSIVNREVLDVPVLEEFENQSAQFRALFLVEHNEDGTHRASPEVTNFVPSGGIIPYAGSTAPDNWLLCDGSQVNRVTYKRLFDLIGTTYGAGDGSTTFNIPDLRQRFPLGKAAAGTGSVLGSTGGNIDHTHSTPNHTHSISGSTASESSHTHGAGTYQTPTHDHGGSTGTTDPTEFVTHAVEPTALRGFGDDPAHSHTISSQAAMSISGTSGSGSSHSHGAGTLAADSGGSGTSGAANPPFISLNFIIKT